FHRARSRNRENPGGNDYQRASRVTGNPFLTRRGTRCHICGERPGHNRAIAANEAPSPHQIASAADPGKRSPRFGRLPGLFGEPWAVRPPSPPANARKKFSVAERQATVGLDFQATVFQQSTRLASNSVTELYSNISFVCMLTTWSNLVSPQVPNDDVHPKLAGSSPSVRPQSAARCRNRSLRLRVRRNP